MIKVEQLVKRFNSIRAVDGVSLEVKEGELFGFLGPNGAGKTTTIKILTTLLHDTSGTVLLDGYDPDKNPDEVIDLWVRSVERAAPVIKDYYRNLKEER